MPSRLLARAQRSSSVDTSRRDDNSTFERLPDIPDALCCRPEGRIDAGRVEALNANIVAELDESSKIIFLDFSRVDDITAAGVGFLVALKKRMRTRNGDLIIYGLRPKQQRFLDILGFRGFFSVALDLRYAIEYILETKRDIFPISALCPACSSPLGIDGPGRRRCRACKAVLTVMADGTMELG